MTFELKSDREAGALLNAEERTKSFPSPLHVKTSTHTTKRGQIWTEFLLGDQRFFYVPCKTPTRDTYVDIAGYARCAAEIGGFEAQG